MKTKSSTARLFQRTALGCVLGGLLIAGQGIPAASAETIPGVQTISSPQGALYGITFLNGNVFVTESDTGVIKSIDTRGTAAAVVIAGSKDAKGTDVHSFSQPKGIAVSQDGTLFVADSEHHVIKRISPSGEVKVIAGTGKPGLRDGAGKDAEFHSPAGIALAADGTLYVADTLNHRIRKIDASGTVTTIAGSGNQKDGDSWLVGGFADGKATDAKLNEPSAVALDTDGTIYIADTGNQRIRMLKPDGDVATLAGGGSELVENRYIKGGYADGSAADARFNSPLGLAVGPDHSVYVADTWNNSIRVIQDGTVRTVAGGNEHGRDDGWGVDARLDGPTNVAIDSEGSLWVADHWNRSIRKIAAVAIPDRQQQDSIRLLNGTTPLHLQNQPFVQNGSTYVPLREIAEQLRYTVGYDKSSKLITLTYNGKQQTIKADQTKIVNGRAMVTIREIGKLIDMNVNWSPTYRLITLAPLPNKK